MISDRIKKLRDILRKNQIEGYIIPSNDEYMNEYTPKRNKKLEFITGFTGSNGVLLLTQDSANFFTDGRYLDQSKQQLDKDIFTIIDLKELSDYSWQDHDKSISFGYNSQLFTQKSLESFNKLKLVPLTNDFIEDIWSDRPEEQKTDIYCYPVQYAGEDYKEKIVRCQNIIKQQRADALILTTPDSISWLLNLRSNEIPFSPLVLGKMILTSTESYLFINNSQKITKTVAADIAEISILKANKFAELIVKIGKKILIDKNTASLNLLKLCSDNNKDIIHITDPCQMLKACKNAVEINGAINIHIKDAVALCEFFSELDDILKQGVTEYELGNILTSYRKKQVDYIMDSFSVICGFKENSAIIHYQAEKNSAKFIDMGMLLIDSGGQYLGGTTDITRTIMIGKASDEQKKRYTQVLKGHIALSNIIFPIGISGANLDVLARQHLWQDGLDYPHGTGHGVGNFLSVHEGPQNINLRNNIILKEGMILSNEPGYYSSGKYGIRIENLQYVKKSIYQNYLCFESLTLFPYDQKLIDSQILSYQEKQYLKNYYNKIKQKILHLLSSKAAIWLENQLNYFGYVDN